MLVYLGLDGKRSIINALNDGDIKMGIHIINMQY